MNDHYDEDQPTPADLERAAENEAQDAHYAGDPLLDLLDEVPPADPLADCPHPADGFVTVSVVGGTNPRRVCGACWKDFGPATLGDVAAKAWNDSDALPAPTSPAVPFAMTAAAGRAAEFQAALERVAGVLRDHAPILVTALQDELKRVRAEAAQARAEVRYLEGRIAEEQRRWSFDHQRSSAQISQRDEQIRVLEQERGQLEADVLELLGIVEGWDFPTIETGQIRERLAALVELERYAAPASSSEQPGEIQQRTGTMPLAGSDPDDHALSGS